MLGYKWNKWPVHVQSPVQIKDSKHNHLKHAAACNTTVTSWHSPAHRAEPSCKPRFVSTATDGFWCVSKRNNTTNPPENSTSLFCEFPQYVLWCFFGDVSVAFQATDEKTREDLSARAPCPPSKSAIFAVSHTATEHQVGAHRQVAADWSQRLPATIICQWTGRITCADRTVQTTDTSAASHLESLVWTGLMSHPGVQGVQIQVSTG